MGEEALRQGGDLEEGQGQVGSQGESLEVVDNVSEPSMPELSNHDGKRTVS